MILTIEETKEWLRIDGDDENQTIQMLIVAAEGYLKNATGKTFTSENMQAKIFCLTLVTDWYENREITSGKPGEYIRFSIQSMMVQLMHCDEEVN